MPPKRKQPDTPSQDIQDEPPAKKLTTNTDDFKKSKKIVKQQQPPPPKKIVEVKIKNDFIKHFKECSGSFDKEVELMQQVVDEENHFRELFAQSRDSPILDDPYLMLINAHEDNGIFTVPEKSEKEVLFIIY